MVIVVMLSTGVGCKESGVELCLLLCKVLLYKGVSVDSLLLKDSELPLEVLNGVHLQHIMRQTNEGEKQQT